MQRTQGRIGSKASSPVSFKPSSTPTTATTSTVVKSTRSISSSAIRTSQHKQTTTSSFTANQLKRVLANGQSTAGTSSTVHTQKRFFDEKLSNDGVDASRVDHAHKRNIAIIAHVDHGKTTMVDSILSAGGTRSNTGETRLMDSNSLEKERGITILAKCTSVLYPHRKENEEYQINIVDTPGHADFGGEVERIMTMVDGVCLIVDASDGPMTQTKFVLNKALQRGLKPIVVINKVDRPSARIGEVENEIFDMFVNLDADDDQLEYPVVYASGKNGWASLDSKATGGDMHPLLEAIIEHVPPPRVEPDKPFSMLVTQIESDNFFGKCLIGRVQSGTVKPGDSVKALDEEGNVIENTKILKVLRRRGMNRFIIDEAQAGDIVSVAGFSGASVNATLCAPEVDKVIPSIPIDPPTLSMTFQVNDSPLAGREGQAHTSNSLRNRLQKEAENNVSIRVMPGLNKELTEVHARGEMQLGIIIETIRREGFELAVSPPQVVFDLQDNELVEPVEEVLIDMDENHSGTVIEKMSKRGGDMKEFNQLADGRVRVIFEIPSRGFLGFRSEFMNDTRGQGVINSTFHSYTPFKGNIERSEKGALISTEDGTCTAYALETAESRGTLFVEPGTKVYQGMVIGENNRSDDIEINPCKAKQLSNVRTVMKEDKTRLTPPKKFSLEEIVSYVRDDEIIEVTPESIRLRKKILDPTARKSANRSQKNAALRGIIDNPKFADYFKSKGMKL